MSKIVRKRNVWPGISVFLLTLFVWYSLHTPVWAGQPNAWQTSTEWHEEPKDPYVPGEVLVLLSADVDGDGLVEADENLVGVEVAVRGTVTRRLSLSLGRQVLRVKLPAGKSVATALAENWGEQDPRILVVEPDYRVHILAVPNDPRFSELWGLNNTGQTGGTPDADIDAPEAWDVNTGSADVIVAVIDTGIDYLHPDLVDNMWVNTGEIPGNGIDDDGNGYVDDVYGYDFLQDDGDPSDAKDHGTHCAGTIAARGNNGLGVTGVNWQCKLMACRFLNASGSGSTGGAIEAINYAVANGADVLSNSWGSFYFSASLEAAIENARDNGVLFVAAAGNWGMDNDIYPHYPSSYKVSNVISVAATDHTDTLAGWSNYGAESVDLAAPGVSILSTVPNYETLFFEDFQAAGTPGFGGTQMTTEGPLNRWGTILSDIGTSNIVARGDWQNSKKYLGGSDGSIVTPSLDTRGLRGLAVEFSYRYEIGSGDALTVDVWDGTVWRTLFSRSNSTFFGNLYFDTRVDIPEDARNSAMKIRFRWVTDAIDNKYYGAEIDNIRIRYINDDTENYGSKSGTSMATPHVAGAAAFFMAQDPGLTLAELKAKIMQVDWLPSLHGLLISGGRLNLAQTGPGVPYIIVDPEELSNTTPNGQDAPWQLFTICSSGPNSITFNVTNDANWLQCTPASGTAGIGALLLDQAVINRNYGFWFERDAVRWQEFRPSASPLSQIDLQITRRGSPGDMTVEIRDEGDATVWSAIIPEATSPIGKNWVPIVVDPPLDVTPETLYRIYVASVDPRPDADNSYYWECDTGSTYDRGISSVDTVWPGTDFLFKTYTASDCAEIVVNFNTSALPEGVYSATITIESPEALNSPVEIPVSLTVGSGLLVYVDDDAPPGGDGSSWANAFNYLQDALAVASNGDQIWVAEGTYTPDSNSADPDGTGDREATFQLINGVAIYGGYTGFGEPDPNFRDVNDNETILSGDLNGNDIEVAEPCDLLDEPTRGENSYHVVTGSGTDETAILDGFIVTAGNASEPLPSPHHVGGGICNYSGSPTITNCTITANSAYNHGGGMCNYESSPTVTNCTFHSNYADSDGGGMENWNNSNPTVTNCTFSGNSAYSDGGGMDNWDNCSPTITNCTFRDNSTSEYGGGINNYESSPTLTNCTFRDNSTSEYGGGMCNEDSSPRLTNCTFSGNSAGWDGGGMENDYYSDPTLTNCTFSSNSAGGYGGGMDNWNNSSPRLTNCTFSGNSAEQYGGGMYNYMDSNPTLTNCILWGNTASSGAQIYDDGSSPTVSYCDVQGGYNGNMNADPLFVNSPNNLRLSSGSPCIDAGDNTAVPGGVTTDLDGNPRIVNGIVDMGAYEYEAMVSCFGVNHVKLETKAGKKGNKVELKGTFDPASPIDFAVDDVTYTIDDGQGHMLSFIIPAGSFEPDGKPEKQMFKFDSPKGNQPDIKAKFDFLKCTFELKVKGVMDTSEITGTSLTIVLQAGANVAEDVVQVKAKPKHLEYKRKPKLDCCQM